MTKARIRDTVFWIVVAMSALVIGGVALAWLGLTLPDIHVHL
jgi:hypothetical protein